MFRRVVVESMFVMSFAAALLGSTDVRAEQPPPGRSSIGRPKKSFLPSLAAKPAGAAFTTQNI